MENEINENEIENKEGNIEVFKEDAIITLYDDKDVPIEFYEVASVEYKNKFYEILQPVQKIEGIADDEAVIFEFVSDSKTGEKSFKPVFDEGVLEAVFSLYLAQIAKFEAAGGCSGGGCSKEGGCGGISTCETPSEQIASVTDEVVEAEKKPAKSRKKKA